MGLTPAQLMEKMRKYCAYQERSHQQVRDRLYDVGVAREDVEEMIAALILENFLNEERFARSYARGKFRMNGWGRIKIVQGLKQHRVHPNGIRAALTEIDEMEYFKTLENIISQKNRTLKEKNPMRRRAALVRFATQRGFESDLVLEAISNMN
jgi:regulatory protein